MPEEITIGIIDSIRDMAYDLATTFGRGRRAFRYADIRIEVSESKGAAAENGQEKFSGEDYGFSFGVRVLAGSDTIAPGYYGRMLGSADVPNLARTLREGLDHAYGRAQANARRKSSLRDGLGSLGSALVSTELAPIDVRQDTLHAQYEIDPRTVPLADVTAYVRDVSKAVAGLREGDSQVVFNFVSGGTGLVRQLFVSSEGANIDHTYALTEGMVYVASQSPTGSQELYDFIGQQRGWEVLTQGYHHGYIEMDNLMDFATALGRDVVKLANCRPCPATDRDVVVVTDPHYNALVCHEVIGHPTELDRALKFETGYAGRSWFLRDLNETQIGRQVASPLVTAFSNPTMEGFGQYLYDDEGTPARYIAVIENGIFKGFMNSRQTAAIVGAEPNGHYKATDASLVPLIRMSNTAFAGGDRDPQAIIREVEHGYYISGHRIPSVAESRENFRITAMKVFEIRNGELGEMFRDGGITADSRDYFMSIDAVGSDFRLFSIPNCGKGQPMQTKRMGNGGPTMRGRAKLTGPAS